MGRRGTNAGRAFDLGPAGLLELEGSGILVVVGSLRRQWHELAMAEMMGVELEAMRCIVVKSRGHFRAGFDQLATDDRILEVDGPGMVSPVLSRPPLRVDAAGLPSGSGDALGGVTGAAGYLKVQSWVRPIRQAGVTARVTGCPPR